MFRITGRYRGEEFIQEQPNKKAGKTEVAKLIREKLMERDELEPYLEAQTIFTRAKDFMNKMRNGYESSNLELLEKFNGFFHGDPESHIQKL